MTLPRITIRRLMILVALVAVMIVGVMAISRYTEAARIYRDRAKLWAGLEINVLMRIEINDGFADDISGISTKYEERFKQVTASSPVTEHDQTAMKAAKEIAEENRVKEKAIRAESEKMTQQAAFRTAMKKKYEYASRYPWLPVAPDPEEPE